MRASGLLIWAWLVAATVVGCAADATARRGTEPAAGTTRPTTRRTAPARVELTDVPLEGAPSDAPITVQRARFPRGSSLRLTDTTTHETVLVVLEGTLAVAPVLAGGHDARVPLTAGAAVRVPAGTPEADVSAMDAADVRALIARVRCGDHQDAPCRPGQPGSARGQTSSVETTRELVLAGGSLRVHIVFPSTAGERTGLSLERFAATAGAAVPRHVHETSAEILVIEAGAGTMHLGDREIAVRPGMGIYVPANTPHDFACTEALLAWQLYGPSGPEMRFRAAAEAQ